MALHPPVGLALQFIAGRFKGGELPLLASQEVMIGREEGVDLVLNEEGVSRHHAKVITYNNTVELRDLGSTNGTYINGARVDRALLQKGDKILIGRSLMLVIPDPIAGTG